MDLAVKALHSSTPHLPRRLRGGWLLLRPVRRLQRPPEAALVGQGAGVVLDTGLGLQVVAVHRVLLLLVVVVGDGLQGGMGRNHLEKANVCRFVY